MGKIGEGLPGLLEGSEQKWTCVDCRVKGKAGLKHRGWVACFRKLNPRPSRLFLGRKRLKPGS
jgi:hypothetical protein